MHDDHTPNFFFFAKPATFQVNLTANMQVQLRSKKTTKYIKPKQTIKYTFQN